MSTKVALSDHGTYEQGQLLNPKRNSRDARSVSRSGKLGDTHKSISCYSAIRYVRSYACKDCNVSGSGIALAIYDLNRYCFQHCCYCQGKMIILIVDCVSNFLAWHRSGVLRSKLER